MQHAGGRYGAAEQAPGSDVQPVCVRTGLSIPAPAHRAAVSYTRAFLSEVTVH